MTKHFESPYEFSKYQLVLKILTKLMMKYI